MKRLKNAAFFLFFLTIFASGLYGMKAETRGIQCDCRYVGGIYGVIAPATPQGGQTCSPVNCWYPLAY